MVVWHGIEEVGISNQGCWCVDRLPLCKAALTVNDKPSPRCGKVLNMSENTKEIETIEARNKPTWLPPDPILSLGVRARLIYERFRAKSEI